MNLAYWLETPADDWERAIPIGNGRLGASVWGNIDNERITINEEHMWYGADRERRNESAGQYVGKIRELLLQGKVEDAQFLCQMAMTGTPKYIAPYQMACDLNFLFFYEKENGAAAKKGQRRTNEYAHERISGYRRELDMECAVTRVRFRHDLTDYEREFFVSARYQVLAMRIRAGGKGKLRFQFNINRRPFEERSGGDGENLIYLEGRCGDGAGYYGAALLGEHDGKSCRIGDYLAVWDAAEAVVYFDFETDQSGERPGEKCRSRLFKAVRAGYGTILREHVRDYRSLFDRMRLEIADRDFGDVPMGQLLARTEESAVRRYLMQLLFAFGRYLMISSSYQCDLPANLQGIWCGSYTPSWESKYTININLQMNYWMVDSCGLSECFEPFVKLLLKVVEKGKTTARRVYGCSGSVAHHNTDCYGNADVEGLPATAYMWPMGEAWLSLHLYDHFLYTQDGAFLTSTALPVMEESIQFFYEYLYRGEDGSWLSGPSVSPENKYMTADGQTAAITMSPAMDNQILRELCTDYLEGCRLAGVWTKERGMAEEILEHIPTVTIAGDGRIREWYQDYEETEKGHRHISHLFALYPGNQIHRGEPELAEAAKKTLDARLKNGGGHTGWSRVWLICMFARLGDKKAVGDNIRLFLERSVLENLYDSHPPFQIDGNLGICAAAAEMLAQKRGEELELLAAAPEEWTRGSVRGLRLKQGDILDMTWEEEGLSYRIHPTIAHKVRVQYAGQSEELLLEPGKIAEGRFMAPP